MSESTIDRMIIQKDPFDVKKVKWPAWLVGIAALIAAALGITITPPGPGDEPDPTPTPIVEPSPEPEPTVEPTPPPPPVEEGDCRGPEDNEPPPEAPRCSEQQGGDPTRWSDCWTCTGRSGGKWEYIPPKPEPVCESYRWFQCGEHRDGERIFYEDQVRAAVQHVLATDPRYTEGQTLPEGAWDDYAAAVGVRLEEQGLCASKVEPPFPSREEIAVWQGPDRREHWDLVVGHADRIGEDQLFVAWICRDGL